MQTFSNHYNIRRYFMRSNIIALIISSFLYVMLSVTIEFSLNKFYSNHTILNSPEERTWALLQSYINNNHVSIQNIDCINDWMQKQSYCVIKLYSEDYNLLYDSIWTSSHLNKDALNKTTSVPTEMYYELTFFDGIAYAQIFCFPEIEIQHNFRLILFIFCCCFFFVLVYFLSSKYAKKIEQKMQLLKLQKETFLTNYELITSISHDLRTPLTSLISYLEISMNDKLCTAENLPDYQRAALQKAIQIKDFSDTLFEYFWVTNPEQELQTEQVYGNELIFQMIEEPLSELESDGTPIIRNASDITCQLMLNIAFIQRVFDNIFSNIKKYADLSKPITASYSLKDGFLVLTFANQKRSPISRNTKHNVGLKSCQAILQKHHGNMDIEQDEHTFKATLYLPYLSL